MDAKESFRDALESLSSHRLRAGLSMLGMIFGVGAVIAMLSIGAGAEQQALALIEQLGLRNVVIEAKELNREDLMEIREKSPGLSRRDMEAVSESIPGVEWVEPRVKVEPYRVFSGGERTEAMAYGVSHLRFVSSNLRIAVGRALDEFDEQTHAQVCVIGSGVQQDLFGYESAMGQSIKINDVWLEVVGVLDAGSGDGETIQNVRVGSTAGEIYLPYTTALRKFDRPPLDSPYDQIVVRMGPETSPWQSATMIRPLLDLLHGGAEDYSIVVPEQLLEQSRQTQRLFNIVMGCIAGISLLVGGIGIMNIMLASVLERTREIGLRRAVGARPRDIQVQFMVESFAISLFGGVAGIMMGLLIAYSVALYAGWPTLVTAWSILLSSGVSIAVGMLSGLYPAARAAELDPVIALGYE